MSACFDRAAVAMMEERTDEIVSAADAAGMAAAVINSRGEVLYERMIGFRDRENRLPVDRDTIFGIASMTKSFVSLCITQMEDDGLIQADMPLEKLIPEYEGAGQRVSLRHLMCHAGGFFPRRRTLCADIGRELGLDEARDGDFAALPPLLDEGRKRIAQDLASLAGDDLIGAPGRYYSYCNDGFGLLSEVIRLHSGAASFDAYLQKRVFGPLGMDRSSASYIGPSRDANAAVLYTHENGTEKAGRDYHYNAFALPGAGCVKSTVNDLLKALRMYLNGGCLPDGGRMVSVGGMREMLMPRILDGAGGAYARGLAVRQISDLTVIGHGGSLPGVSSHMLFCPDADRAAVVLCNTEEVPVSVVADMLLRASVGLPVLPDRDIRACAAWPDARVPAYMGTYSAGEGDSARVFCDAGRFFAENAAGVTEPLIPTGPETAVVRRRFSDLRVRFYADERRGVFGMMYGSRILQKVI